MSRSPEQIIRQIDREYRAQLMPPRPVGTHAPPTPRPKPAPSMTLFPGMGGELDSESTRLLAAWRRRIDHSRTP